MEQVSQGKPFGQYRLIELLGRGGMGEVWRAFDTATQRVVAVKVLPTELAADPVFEQRFRHEAYTAAGLNHPHVVPIHNFGEIEGRLYVDMRLIEGHDLQHVLAHGPLDPARAVTIVEQIASALNAAHRVGLVHRDVKPSNILLAEDDFAYLIDFGIARGTGEASLTGTGNVVGTWSYMAPERFTEGRADTRSDIYALACVLYECLTCSRPFPGQSVEEQIAGHLTAPPPRPSSIRPGVTSDLDAVIAVGMAKKPEHRYSTATELAGAARVAVSTAAWTPPPPLNQQPTVERRKYASAPNQHRPADHAAPVTSRRPPWWQRTGVAIPVGVAMIAAAVVTIVVVVGPEPAQPDPATGAQELLDGTFTVEFGARTNPYGASENTPGGKETWVIKSVCRGGGCVATASRVSGLQAAASTLVLDKTGDRWTAVGATAGTCDGTATEWWEKMSLQQRSDGTLVGEFIARSTTGCAYNQQVTLARTGNVQTDVSVADPAAQPAQAISTAQALHGHYRETDTYASGSQAYADFAVQTYCLRAGGRCLSYWLSDKSKSLVFEGDRWRLTTTSLDVNCKSGDVARAEVSLEYPLPESPQDPIKALAGRGRYTVAGPCPFSSDFDSNVTRTGD